MELLVDRSKTSPVLAPILGSHSSGRVAHLSPLALRFTITEGAPSFVESALWVHALGAKGGLTMTLHAPKVAAVCYPPRRTLHHLQFLSS